MLNTVLFDMGGTLEDIWNTQETQAKAMVRCRKPCGARLSRDAARRSLIAGHGWLKDTSAGARAWNWRRSRRRSGRTTT